MTILLGLVLGEPIELLFGLFKYLRQQNTDRGNMRSGGRQRI